MSVLFDTSVLVTAVVDTLPNHPPALAYFQTYSEHRSEAFCSTHALAECYATLTALPLPVRIQTGQASFIIRENFLKRLSIVELTAQDYREALRRVTERGLVSGAIYDALHLQAALRAGCRSLATYNLNHFQQLGADDDGGPPITITRP